MQNKRDAAIRAQVVNLLVAMSDLESAAFDLFKDSYPEYTPVRPQLKAVAFLLRKHGAEAVAESFVQTLMRGVDPAGADKYLYAILRNKSAQRKEHAGPREEMML